MRSHITIGKVLGVPIALHVTWVLIAVLISVSLAVRFEAEHPGWSLAVVWSTAIITGLLFFAGLILHELAHAAAARASGVSTRSITLFAFGGLAHMPQEPPSPKAEFWTAVAGPLISLALGVLLLAVPLATGWMPGAVPSTPVMALLVWLGSINLVLAIFNLFPGYPLDGGRVLRSLVWAITGDRNRATKIAAAVGQVVAFVLIAYGLAGFFGGGGFGALWLGLIGWFLLMAAQQAYSEVDMRSGLTNVRVADVMSLDCESIDPRTTVSEFVEQYVLRTGRRCFVVQQDGTPSGLVTLHEIRNVDRERWPTMFVRDIMLPIDEVRTVGADAPVTQALDVMTTEDVAQLPVVTKAGDVAGTVSRNDVLRLLRTRAEVPTR
jgi:Zn-dependent protease/predicted transcriptional regulator